MTKVQKSSGPPPPIHVPPEVRSEARDALADHFFAMKSMKDLPYYWHGIIGVHDGGLLHRLGVDALTYASVMFVAGLFDWRKVRGEDRYVLSTKLDSWNQFIAEMKLGDFLQCSQVKVTAKLGVDGKPLEKPLRMMVTFLKVGDAKSKPPRDYVAGKRLNGRMLPGDQINQRIRPPRINLASAIQDFCKSIESLIHYGLEHCNYAMTADMMEETKIMRAAMGVFDEDMDGITEATDASCDEASDDEDEDDDDDDYSDDGDGEGMEDFDLEGTVDADEVGDAAPKPAPELYHNLKTGVMFDDPTDPKNRRKLMELVGESIHALSKMPGGGGEEERKVNFVSTNNKVATAVWMKKADYAAKGAEEADKTFQRGASRTKLAKSLAVAVGGKDNEDDAAYSIIKLMGKKYPAKMKDVVRDMGLASVLNKMSKEEAMAVIEDMGITTNQFRMMKRKIESFLPEKMRPLFPTERDIETLTDGYFEPVHGKPYYYKEDGRKAEKIEWWYKPVDELVTSHLKQWFETRRRKGRRAHDLDRVAIIIGGDHGQGAFIMMVKIVMYFKNGNQIKKEMHTLDVGHVDCRKDNYDILSNTLLTKIGDSLKGISAHSLRLTASRGLEVVPNNHRSLGKRPMKLFVTGDLLFYSIVLGRVAPNHWCFCCKLHPKEWKKNPFSVTDRWTMDEFIEMAKRYSDDAYKTDGEYLGQRRKPEWPFIDILDWACPFLHIKIGLGNDIMSNFMDWIDREIIKVSLAEIEARNSLAVTEASIEAKTMEKDMIESSIEEIKIELQEPELTSDEKRELRESRTCFMERLKDIKSQISGLKQVAKRSKDVVDKKRAERLYDDESTENKINKVLAVNGIKREDYFAKKFNGVNIGYIMKATDALFQAFIPILKADNKGDLTEAKVEETCKQYKQLLDATDAALSYLHKEFPSQQELIDTEKAIQNSVNLAYNLGLSVTPKWHIFAVHIFAQHERLVKEGWGGIFILDESFIEKSHQRMVALRRRMRGLRTYKKQQRAAAKIEHASNNPTVDALRDKHREKKKRKGTGTVAANANSKKQALEVKREAAIATTVTMNTGNGEGDNNGDEAIA